MLHTVPMRAYEHRPMTSPVWAPTGVNPPVSLTKEATDSPSRQTRRPSTRVQAMGALALGAIALGTLAIGAVAIASLAIGHARIRRLEIGELVVGTLRVTKVLNVPPRPDSQD